MNFLKISVIAALLLFCLISCKKDDAIVNRSPGNNSVTNNIDIIKGLWIGEYKITTRSTPAYFSFDIQPNSQLYLLNAANEVIGSGSWALNDSTFNAYYIVTATQQSHFVTGLLHTCPTKLAGKWQFNNNYEDEGEWWMEKM
ncbi:MAG: hypothetical protein QM737_15565 [Ferruginibacter sp.]